MKQSKIKAYMELTSLLSNELEKYDDVQVDFETNGDTLYIEVYNDTAKGLMNSTFAENITVIDTYNNHTKLAISF
jgi:hypothetical protein